MSALADSIDAGQDEWRGESTSVVEFLRPLRAQLDAPGVLEVCVNRPGQMLVEKTTGWETIDAPALWGMPPMREMPSIQLPVHRRGSA